MTALADEVVAERLELRTVSGERVFALRCGPRAGDAPRGLVLLPPGYERRIHHFGVLSRYLVRHGYATLRFDLTDHLGMSDGEIIDFTLSSMAEDVAAVLTFCLASEPDATFVVASSLAARATVRALATDPGAQQALDGVVLILPVIDAEATITAVAGQNVFDDWRSGRVTDPSVSGRVLNNILRYEFARDAIVHGFTGVAGTVAECASLACPVTAIAAERDDWVRLEDVQAAMDASAPGRRSTIVLEATSHELSENPAALRSVAEEMLGALAGHGGDAPPAAVRHLEFDEVVETVTSERAWRDEGYAGLPRSEIAAG